MATDMYGISAEGLEQIILFHDKDLMEVVVAANPHMRVLVGGDGSYSEKEFPGVYNEEQVRKVFSEMAEMAADGVVKRMRECGKCKI